MKWCKKENVDFENHGKKALKRLSQHNIWTTMEQNVKEEMLGNRSSKTDAINSGRQMSKAVYTQRHNRVVVLVIYSWPIIELNRFPFQFQF